MIFARSPVPRNFGHREGLAVGRVVRLVFGKKQRRAQLHQAPTTVYDDGGEVAFHCLLRARRILSSFTSLGDR
jgi:hypothetical protein